MRTKQSLLEQIKSLEEVIQERKPTRVIAIVRDEALNLEDSSVEYIRKVCEQMNLDFERYTIESSWGFDLSNRDTIEGKNGFNPEKGIYETTYNDPCHINLFSKSKSRSLEDTKIQEESTLPIYVQCACCFDEKDLKKFYELSYHSQGRLIHGLENTCNSLNYALRRVKDKDMARLDIMKRIPK